MFYCFTVKSRNKYNLPVKTDKQAIAISDERVHSGPLKYALDFPIEKKVPILAAKGGKVVKVKDDSNQGGDNEKYGVEEYQNTIILKHNNEEYTEYSHLDYKSALVKKSEVVRRGQIISKGVGIIGYTTELHLHFMVFKKTDKYECGYESIKINWKNNLRIKREKKGNYSELTFK